MLDVRHLRSKLLQDRHERVVDEDHAIRGVVDDVDDLLGEQAHVERVQDRADARHRHVELEVALVVPRERADAIAGLDPEAPEDAREAVHARGDLREARPHRPLPRHRQHLGGGVAVAHPPAHVVETQGKVVLHQSCEHLGHLLPLLAAPLTTGHDNGPVMVDRAGTPM